MYNLFRNRQQAALLCAVPEDRPVPRFISPSKGPMNVLSARWITSPQAFMAGPQTRVFGSMAFTCSRPLQQNGKQPSHLVWLPSHTRLLLKWAGRDELALMTQGQRP